MNAVIVRVSLAAPAVALIALLVAAASLRAASRRGGRRTGRGWYSSAAGPEPTFGWSTSARRRSGDSFRNGGDADWSPDGRQIAFEQCRTDYACSVDVIRADGTAQRQLFAGEEPVWSPDAHAIAFLGKDSRRSFYDAIIRARLDGSGRRVLFGQRAYCGCYLLAWGPPRRGR